MNSTGSPAVSGHSLCSSQPDWLLHLTIIHVSLGGNIDLLFSLSSLSYWWFINTTTTDPPYAKEPYPLVTDCLQQLHSIALKDKRAPSTYHTEQSSYYGLPSLSKLSIHLPPRLRASPEHRAFPLLHCIPELAKSLPLGSYLSRLAHLHSQVPWLPRA